MKKLLSLLLTVMIGLSSLQLSAQFLTVADGTASNAYIPVYGFWMDANQHNQIIYPESMLTDMVGEDINTLIFYLSSEPTSAWTSTITLSMGVTQNTSFTSATHDASPVSQVYSGSIQIGGGLITFVLDSAFTYNGGNLLLDVSTTGGNYSGASFAGMAQPGGSMYLYNSNTGVENFIPKTMFIYTDCMAPAGITVDSITQTSAIVNWHPGGQETAWEIFVGNGTEDLSTVTWIPVNDTTYEIQNLSANTSYVVSLRSDCGTEQSYVVSTMFRTACGVNTIPFVEGFETTTAYTQPTCWQYLNIYAGWSYDYPTVISYEGHTGSNCFYLYPDYYTNPNTIQIAILPELDQSLTDLQLSLYSRRDGEYSGTFYVGYITDPTDASTFVPMETLTAADMGDDNWHRLILDYSTAAVDPDSTAYIAFGYQTNTYYYWFVDDIEVTLIPDCSVPVGLSATATTNSATLSWNPGTATTFNVYYKDYNDTAYTEELALSDSTLLIDNLHSSTLYYWYVEAVCSDGSLQTSEVSYFPTGCATIDTLPYFVDFELEAPGTGLPFCWTRGNEYTDYAYPYIYTYQEEAYNGYNSLYFYYPNTVALPEINDEAIDITMTHISFYASAASEGTTIQVGVMTNPNASSTFVPVGNAFTLSENYQQFEISFASYTGNGKYIAFRNPDQYATVYVDDVTLEFLPDCSRPESVWMQTVDSSSATIGWSVLDGQSEWEVVICAHGTSPDVETPVTANTNTYTFNNLTGNTTYDVYVRTICGSENSLWSNLLVINTLATAPATVPYLCNFEDPAENAAWTMVNGSEPNKWYIDTAITNVDNGLYSLYISNDNGATGNYDHGSTAVVWAYRDIQFSDAYEFELSFDWMGLGESCCDYLRVFIGSPTTVTAGSNAAPAGAVQLGQYNDNGTWNHVSLSLGSTYSNATKRLYFMWRNDYSVGYDPAMAVDNIAITTIACAQPANVAVTNVSATSATLTITPSNPSDAEWEVMYGNADTSMITVNVTDVTYLLNNLTPGTNYDLYVRTLCSDGDTSVWTPVITFQTECLTISSVPQSWDFEANNIGGTIYNPMPACWDKGPVSSSYPYVYSYGYPHGGLNCLYFYNYYKKSAAIMPPIDTTVLSINDLQVSFYARGTNTDSYECFLVVGIFSDIYDNSSFVPMDTIVMTNDYPDMPYVVFFNHYTGNGNRIGFMNLCPSNSAYNYIYLDDVTLEEAPSCLPVSHLNTVSADMTSITISWMEGSDESSWNVEYKEASDTVWVSAGTATSVPFTLSNLTAGTLYDIRVQADCGGDYAPWIYLSANTQLCDSTNQCEYTFVVSDSYGDGWNGGYIIVKQNGIEVDRVSATNHNLSGTQTTDTVYVTLCDNFQTELLWHDSQYNSECSFTVIDPFGTILHTTSGPSEYSNPLFTFTSNCFVPSCPAPSNIAVSNITMSEATVTWTPGGDETNWNVEYKLVSDTAWTVVPVAATTHTLTNLTAGSEYDVRVQAVCNPSDPTPSLYDATTFYTTLCNAANQCSYTFVLTDGYGDGWNGGYLTVTQNGIPMATLMAENHGGGSILSTDTVLVALCDNVSTSLEWTAGSYADEAGFTVITPDGTQLYTVQGMTSYTTYTFTTDCGTTPPVQTDPTVATQAASAIGQHTATLNATITNPDNVTITAKGFEWMPLMGTDYTQVAGTGTDNTFTANLSNLDPNTDYIFKAFITFDGTTVYGNELIFTTLPEDTPEPCDVPTGLDTTSVANETISITWNANSGVNSWNIQYRPQNGTWTSTSSSTNSYTITGLTGNTTYEIQIQAVCANGQTSDWSTSLFVTTKNVGISNWLENSVSLYPNPAKEYVDIRVDGDVNVTTMEVYDVYGKLVNTVTVHNNPTRINVSGLADGMYFVRVTTELGAVTKTFVKK